MTTQFIVAIVLFGMAISFTARLWMQALLRVEFRNIANFYRWGFVGFSSCLAALIWTRAFALINLEVGQALTQGLTAAFVLFILFAWARLTVIGLKFDLTHLN